MKACEAAVSAGHVPATLEIPPAFGFHVDRTLWPKKAISVTVVAVAGLKDVGVLYDDRSRPIVMVKGLGK